METKNKNYKRTEELDELYKDGTIKAIRFEEFVWRLRGSHSSKMDKIIDVVGVYRDKVTKGTLAKYFSPVPDIEVDDTIGSINELIMVLDRLGVDIYWDRSYNSIMYLRYE
jgi:hypothetical protein